VNEEIPDEMDVLRALAHPVRWGILGRLAAEPGICACDFTEFFDVSQPTMICYSIAPGQLTSLGTRLTQMAGTADEGLPRAREHEAPSRS
jgi:ArsR family transcriptional regulator